MNKTVTINISGIIFHIEEDGYQNLSAYLASLKARLSAVSGGAEILSDIEARIAELMQGRLSPSKQVIVNDDVEHVKSVMGRPEEFGEEEQGSQSASSSGAPRDTVKRRFFRDPDDRVFGGVCSGLAAYFDVDRVWVRLAMFILVFFGGLSLWVYLILWVIIPEARTTADRLAMRGQPANINTIFQNFREEAGEVKDRLHRYGSELNRNYGDRVRDNMSGVLSTFFDIVGRVVGFILLLIGGGLLLAYIASIAGITLIDVNSDVANWKSALFASGTHYALAVAAFLIVAGIPVLALLYLGVRLLFRVRYSNRWLGLTLGLVWLTGVAMAIYVTVRTAQQFGERASVKDTVDLSQAGDTLHISVNPAPGYYPDEDGDDDNRISHGSYRIHEAGRKIRIVGAPGIDIQESRNGKASMQITYESRGHDKRDAYLNAKAISYHYEQRGDSLVFDDHFTLGPEVKFRAPEVSIRIMLPVGKVVMLDESVADLLDDVDNTSNAWDGDMAGRRWKMTEEGLACVDCQNLNSLHDRHYKGRHRKHVRIGKHGIHVKDDKEEVRIDEHGIHVHSDEEAEIH